MNQYYDNYWKGGIDVSDADITTPQRKQRLIDTLATYIAPESRVLDLGCGGGLFTYALHNARYKAVGMDISENAIALARRQFSACQFEMLHSDGTIPASSGSFTAVWSTEVIEHVLDVHRFLSEIYRVLDPDGILILTTPYHGRFKDMLIALFKFDRHFDPEGTHIRFFDEIGLNRCLRKANFSPLKFAGIGRIWSLYRTWFVVARKKVASNVRTC